MLNDLVSLIDRRLRAREYSICRHCIFRVELVAAASDIALSNGTRLSAGSHLINLHLWNEHIPPFPPEAPALGWARRMCNDLEASLDGLAAFVANNPAL